MPPAFVPCSYTAQDFLSDQTLAYADEAVASVFGMMLGLSIELVPPPPPAPTEPLERTAVVGFSGSLRGSCSLRLSGQAACTVASAMLGGMPIEEGDDSINDAVGEICNMIAGGWKNSIHALASTCSLSPPTVISGCDYKIYTSSASIKITRTYSFAGHTLDLILQCLGPKDC